jgi:hypothetical protein
MKRETAEAIAEAFADLARYVAYDTTDDSDLGWFSEIADAKKRIAELLTGGES